MNPTPTPALDRLLAAQLIVGWAGEAGEDPRLAWWRTDLSSEFGGEDLFRRLLPSTWAWAVLQGAREAARRQDAALRARAADPDQLVTLFHLGFEIDERIEERLGDLKRDGRPPAEALPSIAEVVTPTWDRAAFTRWVEAHRVPEVVVDPAGRRIRVPAIPDDLDQDLDMRREHLVGALAPLGDAYPLPHYRRPR
jgi:hypothetical protein